MRTTVLDVANGIRRYYYYCDGCIVNTIIKICQPYGKKWKEGDVVGCMLDLDNGTMSFSLNEEFLGVSAELCNSTKTGILLFELCLLYQFSIQVAYQNVD